VSSPAFPATPAELVTDSIGGITSDDPYPWLEEDTERTLAWPRQCGHLGAIPRRCRRGGHAIEVVGLGRAWSAALAFRAHLAQPQLSEHLVDLPGQFIRQIRTSVLVRDGADVYQQPGIAPSQLDLCGVEQHEYGVADDLIRGKGADSLPLPADVIRGQRHGLSHRGLTTRRG
jgi:hypothetical protein